MIFLLPPQPVSVSPQRSIFSPDVLGYPPYCSLYIHLEDLESFAIEAFPVVAEKIFHSLLCCELVLEFLVRGERIVFSGSNTNMNTIRVQKFDRL